MINRFVCFLGGNSSEYPQHMLIQKKGVPQLFFSPCMDHDLGPADFLGLSDFLQLLLITSISLILSQVNLMGGQVEVSRLLFREFQSKPPDYLQTEKPGLPHTQSQRDSNPKKWDLEILSQHSKPLNSATGLGHLLMIFSVAIYCCPNVIKFHTNLLLLNIALVLYLSYLWLST